MSPTGRMLRFAILELLSGKPLSGYELKKRFGGSIVFFWRAGHSQIYPELKRMEMDQLVISTRITHEWRPTKKVYAITDKGKAELIEWLGQEATLQAVKDEMMLKCFAFHLIPADEAARQIEHHRALHKQRVERYREIERELARSHGDLLKTSDPILFWHNLTLQHAIAFERMYIEWCDSALEQQALFSARAGRPEARVKLDGIATDAATGAGGSSA